MWRGVWVWFMFFSIILFCAGCVKVGDGDGISDVDRKSPTNLLNFLTEAYVSKDIDRYDESLDDRFQFHFIPKDADDLGLPADHQWWGKTDDHNSTLNMFNAADVKTIVMRFNIQGVWEPGTEDTVDYMGARVDPLIEVTIDTPKEPTTKQVNKSWLDIWAVPDRNYPGLWTVYKIIETPKD